MLKYASRFFLEKIMPSVVATVAGAYIVNHYIVSKPADAPAAAAISTADPVKASDAAAKASDGSTRVANIPEAGVRARGISEKAIERTPVAKVIEKNEKPAEAATQSEETRRHSQARHEKATVKATPAEAAANPDERRDATDLARAAIERLRGTGEPARAQDTAPRQSEPPRVAVQETPRPAPPSVQPLPPAIMVSTPRTEMSDPQPRPEIRSADPRGPIPPADIPEASPPLDLQASAAPTPTAMRAHTTTVADDVLSAAKSVFQAVLPR